LIRGRRQWAGNNHSLLSPATTILEAAQATGLATPRTLFANPVHVSLIATDMPGVGVLAPAI
jgi:hypothetical protein